MRIQSTLIATSLFTLLSALAPQSADACSYIEVDPRFFKHEAAPGGVFFVHENWGFDDGVGATELPDDLLLDEDGNTYPVEVISRAGRSFAIRAPDAAPGTTLKLQSTSLLASWDGQFGERTTVDELIIIEGSAPTIVDAPVLTGVETRNESSSYTAQVAALPGSWTDSCGGGGGPGIYNTVTHFEAQVLIPAGLLDGRQNVIDAWVTEPGETVDVEEDAPLYASVAGGDEGYFGSVFRDAESGSDVLRFPNYGTADESFDVHLRVRDPANGLSSSIVTLSLNVPARTETAGGCSATGDQSSLLALALSGLLFGVVVRRRRRR